MLCVDGEWSGWDGDTIVTLTYGSVWHQDEYYCEYRYAYGPKVAISNGKMQVHGMSKAVGVQRM